MKLAVVGGGSTYTPELVSGLSRERERVPVDELVLHDIDPERRTVILTRQFRLPAFVNGHADGMLIEAPAGLLDGDDPEAAVRREAEEESGVRIGEIRRLFELFMSPGSVTERVTFFAATYSHDQRVSAGGGPGPQP